MTIDQHLDTFHDLPVRRFGPPSADHSGVTDHGSVAWRVHVDPYGDEEEAFTEAFGRFRETVELEQVSALVIGSWGEVYDSDSSQVVESILAVKDRLTSLRALFIGDLVLEEAEISWIEQSDLTPLLEAFPALEVLGIRGGTDLVLKPVEHAALRTLLIETGGLPGEVARAVGDSRFPALERLELWIGQESYGCTTTTEHLAGVLAGTRLPALHHLGLRNADEQDAVAAAVAAAPVVRQLRTLDLSMGALTDAGADALLAGQSLAHLRSLDLSYHYLSDDGVARVQAAMDAAGVAVDLSDQQHPYVHGGEEHRYSAVGE
ncbi:STM4015 family protein [Streptomyces bohaiensis]|uniref:Leucine-rich repeat domain-containing protein n=1 Tax=Streptomyces bohaiensis TaxID=1431344 RepID=A0ABX1CHS6_9ACTN|nr:STM4015 family protein [Streptomyces bohaiensis]NJQ17375.1 leucine-rich repeat domain-containing protein [Streptomyces bohaiensis]